MPSNYNKNIQLIDDWLRRARKNSVPRGLQPGESMKEKSKNKICFFIIS